MKVRPWKSSHAFEEDSLVTDWPSLLEKEFWSEGPSRKGVLTKDKDVGVISKLLVAPLKAAVAQSAGSNQPFVCPCALAGGRLSRCNCEVPKCTC